MVTILSRAITVLVERYQEEGRARKQRQQVIDDVVGRLSLFATDQEKSRAMMAARQAVRKLETNAEETELRMSTEEAVRPIQQAVEKRLLKERLLRWAVHQLPWSKTELDALRVQRECAEILAELPEDFTELEAKGALQPTVEEACGDIERRKAREERNS